MSYQCNDCNYVTDNQFKYKRHLNTKKHIDIINQKEDKEVLYKCNYCNYSTKTKWCYVKHNETEKHIGMKEYIDRKRECIRMGIEREKYRKEHPEEFQENNQKENQKENQREPQKETQRETQIEDEMKPLIKIEETSLPLYETSPEYNNRYSLLSREEKRKENSNLIVNRNIIEGPDGEFYESETENYYISEEESEIEEEKEEREVETENDSEYDTNVNDKLESMFKNGEIKELTPELLMIIIRNNITENKKLRKLLESNIERTKQIERKLEDISKKTPTQITSNTVITNVNQKKNNTKLIHDTPITTTTVSSTTKETDTETVSTTNVNATIYSFLNEKCKDAINIKEFVQSLDYSFKSLEYVGQNGYVDGITKLICDRLKELDTFQRPFHCTDLKREIMYIKEEDVWEKDTPEEGKMRHIIYGIGDKNMKQISKWQEVYRMEISVLDSKMYSFYFNIIHESANVGKRGERNDAKVASNICKMVHLTREEIKNA